MSSGKEVRDKIRSVKSTQKITGAMEMVAASKMRRAQENMEKSRPYSEKIIEVIQHMATSHPEYHHPFMQEREVKRVGVIVVTTDRGLCGGLNINLMRKLMQEVKTWKQQGIETEFAAIGSKGALFLSSFKQNVVSKVTGLGDKPSINDLIGSAKSMIDGFMDGKIDKLYVAYNNFVNTMTQKPEVKQLIPLEKSSDKELKHYWDYIYEPEAEPVVDVLMNRYIESVVYQAVVENGACEQSARMVAMKNATDNAGNLIDELQLVYNKARQAAITAELADIVGGAAAVQN
jgi:F-type H+-transporting ATPase subunit gamma